MKYFTMEELDDITGRLIENPTREILKELNDKYNGSELTIPVSTNNDQVVEEVPMMGPVNPSPVVEPIPNAQVEQVVVNPLPQVDIPVATPLEVPVNQEPIIPSIEIPTQVAPQVNEEINFTGNLWEPQGQNNLMATTDSFNNQMVQNTTVPYQNNNATVQVANQIPVENAMPHIPQAQGPSMFGQFEQNYNG